MDDDKYIKFYKPMMDMEKWFAYVNEHKPIVRLDKGQPDLSIPPVTNTVHSYLEGISLVPYSTGDSELKKQISDYIFKTRGVYYNYESEIVITHGAIAGICASIMALNKICNKKIILIPDPCWPAYKGMGYIAGCDIEVYEFNSERDIDQLLERCVNVRDSIILVNSPHNPTGLIITSEKMKTLTSNAKKNGNIIISDEIYFEYDLENWVSSSPCSYDADKNNTVVVSSFSKNLSMTGFRVGFCVSNEKFCKQIQNMHVLMTGGISPITQKAVIGTKDIFSDYVRRNREIIHERRNAVLEELDSLELKYTNPCVGMYVFIKLPDGIHSHEYCERLLVEKGVSCVPGSYFSENCDSYIRIGLMDDVDNLKKGIRALKELLSDY